MVMHSDDETVDVAGSEEEETDSEREPSAEATISTVAFFYTNMSFFQVPDPPMGLELPTRRCSTEPGWQNSLFPQYLVNILSIFYGSV